MLDFVEVRTRSPKRGITEVYPSFLVKRSQDLMTRGGDFYAIWDEDNKLWSQDEYRAAELIDKCINEKYGELMDNNVTDFITPLYLKDSDSKMIDKWHKYVQKDLRDNYVPLDENIIFANQETTRSDYASKKLSYSLEGDNYSAWDDLVSVLYSKTERHKIEWIIGAIATGAGKRLQKFVVFYGSGGTGKSTILNIIEKLFDGYSTPFDAKALGNANSSFSLEPFSSNPLVAIDHDSKLDRIEDNTRINSLVSHEKMVVNEKHKKLYKQAFNCILLIGTNNPVKITDAKSGIIRRLIDIQPTGDTIPRAEYDRLMNEINFQLGGIVKHCISVYEDNPNYYDGYVSQSMLGMTNHFYDFVLEEYNFFEENDGVTRKAAWDMYQNYINANNIAYPLDAMKFKTELMNYFETYYDRKQFEDGRRIRSYYEGFISDKFGFDKPDDVDKEEDVLPEWLELKTGLSSTFDMELADCPAQYATPDEKPKKKWAEVEKKLKDILTNRLHYVKVPVNHIVLDFDLKDPETGKKSLELNLKAAKKFSPTYAEVSKGGQGLHLHYIYAGDVEQLASEVEKDIEIKIFTGGSSLRRKLTMCNALDIAVISSGLPFRKEKKNVLDDFKIKSENQLRAAIARNILKKNVGSTNQSISLIEKDLQAAYDSGMQYNVIDMRPDIMQFAESSTNHAIECRRKVRNMKFKSEGTIEDNVIPFPEEAPIIFYDVEVFPNLFVLCWKKLGSDKVVKLINPNPNDLSNMLKTRLVGFNNRRYDNHILFAAVNGYTNKELYEMSQRIINKSANAFFGQAWNLSYTDIYDFASAGNKKSLKKFEIELGIHHQELGLDWNEDVPNELWEKVADYCCNDVLATEAVWNHLQGDWAARKILVRLANQLCPEILSTENDTTNTLSTRIIFGGNKEPQDEFCYRNLAEPVKELPDDVKDYLKTRTRQQLKFKPYWCDGPESLLPYFPGYEYDEFKHESTYRGIDPSEGGRVYSKPGIYYNVDLLDIESMHPSSTENECAFGPKYTRRFSDIKTCRVKIKHEDFDGIAEFLDGVLVDVVKDIEIGEIKSKDLSNALKTVINSVYGLTSAGFTNPFKDLRNKDNIVAKRGALFMIDLQLYCEEKGYNVIHIKTDSIKIADSTPAIREDIMRFGEMYGYKFEHEATYERICLINKAVYVAKDTSDGHWTATGKEFQVPYVFKTLFTDDEIETKDLMETFNCKTALYLDYNESLSEDEHSYHFVGRTGAFYPIISGRGGAELRVKRGDSYNYPSGAKGYRWLESEVVDMTDRVGDIDFGYWDKLVEDAKKAIEEYGNFDAFVGDDEIKPFPMNEPIAA